MEKVQLTVILEMVIALTFAGIILCFLAGPCHRMAHRFHGHRPNGDYEPIGE